ncbi:hypothetical protein DFR71_5265 [Nocardia alba]|uniref:Excalibur calcium-binding domain-containing protein n=1 Tax=Nocardia alba TaxID=225051 RepID=A0A4R1FHF2_9NOCA|nr:hypothetical protein [Nocardia alba]TCJ93420.1 hypothetical protein DFR71_5265 [Nocardia alba]
MRPAILLVPSACIAVAIGIALPPAATAEPPGPHCHSSYDPCVPIASDVDCEGLGGDGPMFTGPVRVIGPDEYGLDDNNDGFGCELG